MGLQKEYYQQLIDERLKILVGATYDVLFYTESQKELLDQDDEKLREELADKKVELGNLTQARAIAERKKGALLPEELEKLDKLTEEVNKLSGQGGLIDKIMEAKATIVAITKKRENAELYYKFAKERGMDILSDIESYTKE